MGCIFQKAHTFIGDVEENHSRAEYAAIANDMGVQDMPDTDQCKNQRLAADTFKAHGTGQVFVYNGAHDACDVINHHKGQKRKKQTVTATKEIAKPASDGGEDELNDVPEFFHNEFLTFFINVYEKSDYPVSGAIAYF